MKDYPYTPGQIYQQLLQKKVNSLRNETMKRWWSTCVIVEMYNKRVNKIIYVSALNTGYY